MAKKTVAGIKRGEGGGGSDSPWITYSVSLPLKRFINL